MVTTAVGLALGALGLVATLEGQVATPRPTGQVHAAIVAPDEQRMYQD